MSGQRAFMSCKTIRFMVVGIRAVATPKSDQSQPGGQHEFTTSRK